MVVPLGIGLYSSSVSVVMLKAIKTSTLHFSVGVEGNKTEVQLCHLVNFGNVIVIKFFFTQLSWPGDSKKQFWSSGPAATCSHTRWRLFTVPFKAELQAGKLYS